MSSDPLFIKRPLSTLAEPDASAESAIIASSTLVLVVLTDVVVPLTVKLPETVRLLP